MYSFNLKKSKNGTRFICRINHVQIFFQKSKFFICRLAFPIYSSTWICCCALQQKILIKEINLRLSRTEKTTNYQKKRITFVSVTPQRLFRSASKLISLLFDDLIRKTCIKKPNSWNSRVSLSFDGRWLWFKWLIKVYFINHFSPLSLQPILATLLQMKS